ncbi:hypothetical protein VNO78_31065 [Psophocarpus tetragonolobus]|uniref:AP180 N-terminal homology (ANTH) domain-containing protein n=1 Tax=Psophocarpus tetragonolobus TaxID=3891 RepID=A0AAN9X8Q9_PSOTE
MSRSKRLRNVVQNFKDKTSVIVASLSLKRHVSSVLVHVLRATTHRLNSPPSEFHIAAVLSAGRGSYLKPRTCIDTLMDRLHKTQSATVALKCLFTLHNIVSHAPESLHLQRIDLVYNVVRLVCEDYGRVQRVISSRVQICAKRVDDFGVDELREFVGCLKRLEECRERFVALFVNRKRNDAFWDLIGAIRNKGLAVMEGKWLTVVKGKDEFYESTRFTNPFLEPGEILYASPPGWRVSTWPSESCFG